MVQYTVFVIIRQPLQKPGTFGDFVLNYFRYDDMIVEYYRKFFPKCREVLVTIVSIVGIDEDVRVKQVLFHDYISSLSNVLKPL